jgi:hypothetical protein
MTHFWSKKQSLLYFIKKLKDENQSEQQQNQPFNALAWTRAFLFRQILFAFYPTTKIE